MANLSEVFAAVARLGVGDPKNPTGRDFKVILDAYLKDKTLDTEALTAYVKSTSAPLKAMFEGFAQFSLDSKEVSKSTLDVIRSAMDILNGELHREGISDDERREIREHVLRLVIEAKDESQQDRTFRSRLGYAAIGGAVIVGGVAVFMFTRGNNTKVLEKGLELAGKAAVNSLA